MVTLAALINAAKLTGKELEDLRVLIVGLGAAGIAVAKIFLSRRHRRNIVGCDSKGAVHTDRADYQDGSMPPVKRWFAEHTNPDKRARQPRRRDRRRRPVRRPVRRPRDGRRTRCSR